MKPLYQYLLAGLLCCLSLFAPAQSTSFPAGSFIIDMGITPQTNANALKPYGLVYDLVRNYDVPVYWAINPNKLKDGIDFTYNGYAYKGGTFIISALNRNATVDARIAYWQTQGIVGAFASTAFSAPVNMTITAVPKWTLDMQTGQIAQNYLNNAGIPVINSNWTEPYMLNACNDIFVMPHADPKWNYHRFLIDWNNNHKGAIWSSCHAVSELENMFNPAAPGQQANFLALNSAGPGSQALVPFGSHKDGSVPYNNNSFPADPVMQFLGSVDLATTNGSEQIYLPAIGGGWRPSTKVCVYDPTQLNVPANSPGKAAVIAYGKAYGDNNRGWVMYEAGHSHDKGGEHSVAAQRAFFNFSFMATIQKSMDLAVSGIQSVMISNNTYNLSATIQQAIPSGPYTIQWTSSCGGSFSNPTSLTTTFTPPLVGSTSACVITLKVTDACNRTRFQTFNILVTSGPRPPVANPDSLTFSPDCINVNPAIIVNPLANDSEPDGQPLTISSVTGTNGTWTINPNQTITYVPAPGFYGLATANYTVCDNTAPASLCASSTIKVNISSAVTPPTAVDDAYTIYEDSINVFNVLANDLPLNSGIKIAAVTVYPTKGRVSINPDNTISYLPNADFNGTDSFTYRISSTGGYYSSAKVRVTVIHDCCAPGFYKKITGTVHTTTQNLIATEDSYLKLKAAASNFGTATELILDRETTDKHVGVVNFDLTNLICYATLVRSATLKMYRTGGTDQDISLYALTKSWNENQVTWNNRLTGTAWTNAGGDYNSSQLIAVTGSPVSNIYNWNATSTIHNMVCSTYLYPNYGFIIRADETGGNRTTNFASRENSTAGVIKPTLQVTFDSAAFVCMPIPLRAPMAMPDTAAIISNSSALINVINNDWVPNNNPRTISIIGSTVTSGTASVNSNQVNYIPNPTYQGITSFQYIISDNVTGLKDTATIYVYVTYPPPIANNDAATIYSGDNVTVNILSNDIDPVGIGYTMSILSGPRVGLMALAGGNTTYTAPFNFYGKDTITYRLVNNGTGLCNETNAADTALFIITVLNRPPVAVNDTASTNPCQSLIIDVLDNDSDPENGSLTVAAVSAVSPLDAGTASTDGYRIFFTPNSNYAGASASFTYTITDDATPPAISNPATIIINFSSSLPNRPPVAVNDTVTGIYNNPVFINVTSNDSDPDNDLFDVAIGAGLLMPANGSITLLPNGLIKYTPNNNFFGSDVFEYKITDSHYAPGAGACSPTSLQSIARVYITINNFYIVLSTRGVRLEGLRAGSHNFLAWTVQENATPYACTLERSFDNIRFDPIYSLQATTASNIHRNYQFSDAAVNLPMAYYRVKITATAQAPVYSNTILIKNQSAENALQVFPVPFNDALTISVFANDIQPMKLALFSSSGTLIQQRSFIPIKGLNLIKLDNLAKLPGNTYFITVSQNNSTLKQKIIKVK